jgi:uncharacterized membrane protein YqhA
MIKLMTGLRYGALVTVAMSFVGAFLMILIGAVKVGKATLYYAQGQSNVVRTGTEAQTISHLSQEDGATARIIESLDTFLIAAVLLYFAYGIYALFCARKDDPVIKNLPAAIVPHSLGELKATLGQVILVVLLVLFTRQVWLELNALRWEHLILPGAILLLGAGLRLSGISKHS